MVFVVGSRADSWIFRGSCSTTGQCPGKDSVSRTLSRMARERRERQFLVRLLSLFCFIAISGLAHVVLVLSFLPQAAGPWGFSTLIFLKHSLVLLRKPRSQRLCGILLRWPCTMVVRDGRTA